LITLPLPRRFSVARTLAFLRSSSLGAPYHFIGPRRLRRLVRLGGRARVVEFAFSRAGAHLRVGIAGERTVPRPLAQALRRLGVHVWSLDSDLAQCYRTLRRDPLMTPLVRRCAGLRMIRTPDLYEALLIAVLGQQISVASSESIRRRLMTALGDRVVKDGIVFLGYPPPRRLRDTPPRLLRTLGLSRQKTRYVLEIAECAAAGGLHSAAFDALSDEQAIERLTQIPGVGRWTAEIVVMRGLGRADVFPAGDLGLMVAAHRALGCAVRPGETDLRTLAERWKGWRSYAALYLWRSLGITA
jgi:DNA-3-methyladenine glycosylase II